jgi:methionyl-tRNA formyltransferase
LDVLKDFMADVNRGVSTKVRQMGIGAPAPQLKKEDGLIDWKKPATSLVNLIRGVREWPGAYTFTAGEKKIRVKILSAVPVKSASRGAAPGAITALEKNKGFAVKAGDDDVLLLDVQPEGKKPMSAWAYIQGAHLQIGDRFQ